MIVMSLREAAREVDGLLKGEDVTFCGVSTDSRTLERGQLFFALKGERFDGHDSLAEAAARGACGAIVARDVVAAVPVVRVADTRVALGVLARAWRVRHAIPVIGVTGSNGKTTTKEIAGAILGRRGEVLATRGNLNNHVGVPLTLFGLSKRHTAAVIEMGANGMRDIAELVEIARPTVGLVTMCGPAHLQGFGSIENVALAKGEIYRGLGPGGIAIINSDDRFSDYWRERTDAGRISTFGIEQPADFSAVSILQRPPGQGTLFDLVTPFGHTTVESALDGRHNVYNALAAAAATAAAGATLDELRTGLAAVKPVEGRLNIKPIAAGVTVIDDTYNANPASLAAALDVLARCAGRRWLVLGDMGELGPDEIAQHLAAAKLAKHAGVERIYAVGDLATHAADAFGGGGAHFPTREALINVLRRDLVPGVALLVKASRFMQFDKVVTALMEGEHEC
ncbi:MAG: UDP-N-acetylmuramoyl-tripeptide--D-alanyl-D-alanine ligase [Gammaproteobacteria bacterium]